MQVIIFGATGSLGSHILQQTLAKGYIVRAFTRDAGKLTGIENPFLEVIQGDVNNFDEVLNAIKGVDAVLCALGDGTKGTVRSSGTQNIVKAMEVAGVDRLVCQTTLGVGNSWANLNFFWKHIMFGFLLKKAFRDHELQEDVINRSQLDFTIVRPSAFTNGPSTRDFKIGFDHNSRKLSLKIPRSDVAYFMVEQLRSQKFLKKTISISN